MNIWSLTSLAVVSIAAQIAFAQQPGRVGKQAFTIDRCVNTFSPAAIDSTRAGYEYWFVGRSLAGGKTVKMSVVGPGRSTHPPHAHEEDEFFFILEGKAEFSLEGETAMVGPFTSLYCPPNMTHGIRNVGDTDLKYLVIKKYTTGIDVNPFRDGSHHWYDIHDDDRAINPLPAQRRYDPDDVRAIAENILLFQKANGGWAKNYDMMAVLTSEQKEDLIRARNDTNTTFDNGATHSQVDYLAKAFTRTADIRYRDACLRGMDFILEAQYSNGGWPQSYPALAGYQAHITFNDGAMVGIMRVLHSVVRHDPAYAFLDSLRRSRIRAAFSRGLSCLLQCQVREGGVLTVWGQQHDRKSLLPKGARMFEPAALCSEESAAIVLFLMSLSQPDQDVIRSVRSAVSWFERSRLSGIRVKSIAARPEEYQYHSTDRDVIVVADPSAPSIWARFYELGSGRPLFCNRDGTPVYSLDEVERERRTGYGWYGYEGQRVLDTFPEWERRVAGDGRH